MAKTNGKRETPNRGRLKTKTNGKRNESNREEAVDGAGRIIRLRHSSSTTTEAGNDRASDSSYSHSDDY